MRSIRNAIHNPYAASHSMGVRLLLYWFTMALLLVAAILSILMAMGVLSHPARQLASALDIQQRNTYAALDAQMDELTGHGVAMSEKLGRELDAFLAAKGIPFDALNDDPGTIAELEKRLSALPADARRDALNYYEEYFDAAGPDNEDATAAELGDPAEAARKILEGEGLTPDADPAVPESARGGAVPPTAPEPPAADPQPARPQKHGPGAKTMWLIFAVVIVAALLIQLGVLVLSFAKPSGSPLEKMDFTTGLADAKNITFDIDYGAVTVVVDSGAAEPTLSCTNLRQDWFTFTNTGDNTSPVRVSYKVPTNYNLGKELGPEPEFVLSVPDANTFHFKRLSITAAMGDVEFDNSNTIAADSIDLDLAMGNFTGSTVQAEQFTANISMGDFDLGLLAGVETAKVEAAMGDIGLTVDGRPDDYALDLQTSMGNVMFNGRTMSSTYTQTAAAPRSVTLTAPMGDVVLTTTQ